MSASSVPLPPEVIRGLQDAAREALSTARTILDAVESAIEDEDRVVAFVEGLTEVIRGVTAMVADVSRPPFTTTAHDGNVSSDRDGL